MPGRPPEWRWGCAPVRLSSYWYWQGETALPRNLGIRWRKKKAVVCWKPERRTPELGQAGRWEGKKGGGARGSARPQRSGRRAVPSLEGSPGDPRGPQHPGLNVLSPVLRPCPSAHTGAAAGRDSKMKLWDVVAVCLVLLHTASAFPLPAGKRPPEAPAEDRSLGRRRAPFALSSDCKNRSLPAGVTPTRRPHAPPSQPRQQSGLPGKSRAGAEAPSRCAAANWCPKSAWHVLALPNTEGNTFFCCSFRFRSTAVFPTTTGKHAVFSFLCLPITHTHTHTHTQRVLFQNPLSLFGCAWLC